MKYKVKQSMLSGKIPTSPSKSHSIRAILFASMAHGSSTISNCLRSPDIDAMITACQKLGAKIIVIDNFIKIEGVGGKIVTPDDVINAGNSGQVLRFMAALLALLPYYAVITGDKSIRYNRPMQPLIDGLRGLGALCVSTKNDGYAPIIVRGPIKSCKTKLDGKDSQPVSALIMACAFLPSQTDIEVTNPGEKPWVDLTLSWLDKIGVSYTNDNYEHYVVYGKAKYDGFNFSVPGDFSSILFPVVAALITKSEITLQHVNMDDVQGDKEALEVLKTMGAKLEYNKTTHELHIHETNYLIGKKIDVNRFIDSVPILAVLGCCARGETKLVNASIARNKECDRLHAITNELKKMGADITEFSEGLKIKNKALYGAVVDTYHDHRLVMALSVAGMVAEGETIINDVESVNKSYSAFFEDMKYLGACMEIDG